MRHYDTIDKDFTTIHCTGWSHREQVHVIGQVGNGELPRSHLSFHLNSSPHQVTFSEEPMSHLSTNLFIQTGQPNTKLAQEMLTFSALSRTHTYNASKYIKAHQVTVK